MPCGAAFAHHLAVTIAGVSDSAAPWSPWTADVLDGFEASTDGRITLVRPLPGSPLAIRAPRAVLLHVPGYNDYFFHSHLVAALAQAGYAVVAMDGTAAGRSLRPGQIPHAMARIEEPGDDIAHAAARVAQMYPGVPLVVHAHSTGGLAAAIWAADRPHPTLAALILNAPLMGRHERLTRRLGSVALPLLARWRPHMVVSHHPSVYATGLREEAGGAWHFDTRWKRPEGLPARASWAAAVRSAQRRIAHGHVTIAVPVLVASSARSGAERWDNPHRHREDIVVSVEAIDRLAPRLGTRITRVKIPDAVHDPSLSAPVPRERYCAEVIGWLDRTLAHQDVPVTPPEPS